MTALRRALLAIAYARDYHAEHGAYPPGWLGPEQAFDDWAADTAVAALALSVDRQEAACSLSEFARVEGAPAPQALDPHALADTALHAACASIQDALGDDDGGFASTWWSGGAWDEVVATLQEYAEAEIGFAKMHEAAERPTPAEELAYLRRFTAALHSGASGTELDAMRRQFRDQFPGYPHQGEHYTEQGWTPQAAQEIDP
jgi:hypothetical protein